jgi:NitT/TauT family transport system ATP-binding protein
MPFIDPIALHIQSAGKSYETASGAQTVALEPVTTVIRQGEFVSLVGPSGCGKTTLLKMCAGLVKPTSGTITFGASGQPVQLGGYGIVFQAAALLPWRTVMENVLLPAVILELPMQAARARATWLLDLVQLSHAADKYPRELSGGMQQRVSIARALLHDPAILFMDEPFGALDAMTREGLNLALQNIQQDQGKTIVFVTHDIDEAVLLSDRVLVFSGDPGQLCADVNVALTRPRAMASKKQLEFYQAADFIRASLEYGHTHIGS